jgi:hypothetical protein
VERHQRLVQGSHQPDRAARTLLRVIAFNPELVEQALQHE